MSEAHSYVFIIHTNGAIVEEQGREGGRLNLIVQGSIRRHPISESTLLSAQYELGPERVDDLVTCLAAMLGYSVPKREGFQRSKKNAREKRAWILDGMCALVSVMRLNHGEIWIHLDDRGELRREISFTLSQKAATNFLEKLAKYFGWNLSK